VRIWPRIEALIAAEGRAALVTLTAVAGSTPREAGARMVIAPSGGLSGTVGGGALEFELCREARILLAQQAPVGGARTFRKVLGPDLGQCCGGVADARIEVFSAADQDWIAPLAAAEQTGVIRTSIIADDAGRCIRRLVCGGQEPPEIEIFGCIEPCVALFGAGHVGRALVLALAPLPFPVLWIDERAEAFPPVMPGRCRMVLADAPEAEVAALPTGALVAVMTHSHARDLAIVDAALRRVDLPYVGLIGSETKRARFMGRLRQAGHAEAPLKRFVCPIGGRQLADKSPAVIAAAIVVELLAMREALALGNSHAIDFS